MVFSNRKKLLCQYVVNLCNGRTFQPNNSKQSFLDQFEKAKQCARAGNPAFFLLEDIDTFCPKKDEEYYFYEKNLTHLLLQFIDQKVPKLYFLATSKNSHKIDPSLANSSRFPKEISLNIPTISEREEILKLQSDSLESSGIDYSVLASMTPGFSGADIFGVVQQAVFFALKRAEETLTLTMDDYKRALAITQPTTQRGYTTEISRKTKWEDIGGLEEVKERLKKAVEWPLLYPESFKRFNLMTPKGILLYGPPGTAKTSLVRAVVTSTNVNFFSVNGSNLFSCFLGESEEAVREIFKKARLASPSILFIDEIDGIVRKRGTSEGNNVEDRVLTTLLNEMDGIEQTIGVIVIACTNRIDLLDDALIRPGRIDTRLFVGLPDREAREKIWKIYAKRMPLADDVNFQELANLSEGYSGAEIENICREAALSCVRNHFADKKELLVSMHHFVPLVKKKVVRLFFE